MEITNKIVFLNKILYTEILHAVIYLKDLTKIDDKLYTPVPDSIETIFNFHVKSLRKIVFTKQNGEGIIIGQTRRNEGIYNPNDPGSPPYYDDEAPPYLKTTKRYPFWVVAIGMNKTVLVPKNSEFIVINIINK